MLQFLNGYKTYIAALALAAFGSCEYFFGLPKQIDITSYVDMLTAAAGIAGLRSGLAVGVQKVLAALGYGALPTNAKVSDVKNLAFRLAKRTAPILLVAILCAPLFGLYGCATPGAGGTGNGTGTIGTTIGEGLTAGSGLQGAYITTCAGVTPQSFCAGIRGNAKKASGAFGVTARDLVRTYEAGGDTAALIQQLVHDAADMQNVVNDLHSASLRAHGGRSTAFIDPVTVVTLLNVGIQVMPEVIGLFQEMKNGVSNATLDNLVQTIQDQDARIQAS